VSVRLLAIMYLALELKVPAVQEVRMLAMQLLIS